jgi:hypothetical protein
MQDLSDTARGTLVGDSSMQGGNTVSVNPPFSPVGTESESYQNIESHSRPEPDIGPNNDSQLKTLIGNSSFHPTAVTWKKVP